MGACCVIVEIFFLYKSSAFTIGKPEAQVLSHSLLLPIKNSISKSIDEDVQNEDNRQLVLQLRHYFIKITQVQFRKAFICWFNGILFLIEQKKNYTKAQ